MGSQDDTGEAFVDRFLETGVATADEIDELVHRHAREGSRLEFKGGDWLTAKEKPNLRGHPVDAGPRLCKYVAGFANAAGGVLIVGIQEQRSGKDRAGRDVADSVNGSTCLAWAATESDLKQKAQDALRPVAAQLHFDPRIAVVKHGDGLVLVVGVDRAASFVECHEPGGLPIYYLRTFDGTSAVTDVLAADLLLGRRSRPTFHLEVTGHEQPAPDRSRINVRVGLVLRNEGLVWAEGVRMGLVVHNPGAPTGVARIANGLLSAIETADPGRLAHVPAREANYSWGPLPPFETVTAYAEFQLPTHPSRWSVATYCIAPGHPATWWQTTGRIATRGHQAQLCQPVETTPCRRQRPEVFVAKADD